VVATVLVDRDIQVGEQIVRALDKAGIAVVAAYWYFIPEFQDWRLMIASPEVDEKGPFDLYLRVNELLSRLQPPIHFRPDDIELIETRDPLVSELRIFRGTDPAPFVGGAVIRREAPGDIFIEDCYLYRAARLVGIDSETAVEFLHRPNPSGDWQTASGTLRFRNGFLVHLDGPAEAFRSSPSKNGLNAHFLSIRRRFSRRGGEYAQLTRWEFQDGRLRQHFDLPRPIKLSATSANLPQG
jgi:hypothetical protein